jgi:hypothetical protein
MLVSLSAYVLYVGCRKSSLLVGLRRHENDSRSNKFVQLSDTVNPFTIDMSGHSSHETLQSRSQPPLHSRIIGSTSRSSGDAGTAAYSAVPSHLFTIGDDSTHSETAEPQSDSVEPVDLFVTDN